MTLYDTLHIKHGLLISQEFLFYILNKKSKKQKTNGIEVQN